MQTGRDPDKQQSCTDKTIDAASSSGVDELAAFFYWAENLRTPALHILTYFLSRSAILNRKKTVSDGGGFAKKCHTAQNFLHFRQIIFEQPDSVDRKTSMGIT